jgi:hypothetical protein
MLIFVMEQFCVFFEVRTEFLNIETSFGLKGLMNNELDRIWNEVAVAEFKLLPLYLPGRTEENYQNPQSR